MSRTNRMPFAEAPGSLALLAFNALGIGIYLSLVSRGGWRIPEEQAAGIDSLSGEPFIWAIGAFPIYGIFALVNVVWAVLVLRKHRWSGGLLWLLSLSMWCFAVLIDFAHH